MCHADRDLLLADCHEAVGGGKVVEEVSRPERPDDNSLPGLAEEVSVHGRRDLLLLQRTEAERRRAALQPSTLQQHTLAYKHELVANVSNQRVVVLQPLQQRLNLHQILDSPLVVLATRKNNRLATDDSILGIHGLDVFWTPGLPNGVHSNRPC